MDEEHARRELGEMLGPSFFSADVSDDQRRALVDAFRSCASSFLEVLDNLDEPLRTAYLLRAAARSCDRFAGLAEVIGGDDWARDARKTARDVEALANEAEALNSVAARAPLVGWWI